MAAARMTVNKNSTSRTPTLPSWVANHLIKLPAYGAVLTAKSCTPAAATRSHNSTALAPTKGIFATHSGWEGDLKSLNDLVHSTISSTFATMVPIAKVNGTTKMHSNRIVINATARARLFKSHACADIMSGQVATTIVVAHTTAPRNGRKIQIEDPINATMNKTPRTPRAMSRWVSAIFKPPLSHLIRRPPPFHHTEKSSPGLTNSKKPKLKTRSDLLHTICLDRDFREQKLAETSNHYEHHRQSILRASCLQSLAMRETFDSFGLDEWERTVPSAKSPETDAM